MFRPRRPLSTAYKRPASVVIDLLRICSRSFRPVIIQFGEVFAATLQLWCDTYANHAHTGKLLSAYFQHEHTEREHPVLSSFSL